jgi:hypothetical protein
MSERRENQPAFLMERRKEGQFRRAWPVDDMCHRIADCQLGSSQAGTGGLHAGR